MTAAGGDHAAAVSSTAGPKAAAAQALLDALAGGAGRALESVSHLHLPAGAELGALVPSGAPPTADMCPVALLLAVACCPLPVPHSGRSILTPPNPSFRRLRPSLLPLPPSTLHMLQPFSPSLTRRRGRQ